MKTFSKNHTAILKGIAVILLFIHHGIQAFDTNYFIGGIEVVSNTISITKLCVGIFAVLSGYGMYMSFHKSSELSFKEAWKFVLSHLVKIYLVYWFVLLISVGLSGLIKGNLLTVYKEYPVYYILLNLLGMSHFTKTPSYCNSWWYMSAVVVFYLIFPLADQVLQRLKKWNWALLAILGGGLFFADGVDTVFIYAVFFLIGMIFAERDFFNHMLRIFSRTKIQRCLKVVVYAVLLLLVSIFRQLILDDYVTYYLLDWLLTAILICIVTEVFSEQNTGIKKIFIFLGKYSFELYLVHGIFINYFSGYVYYSLNPLYIVIRILTASVLTVLGIDVLKKIVHFSRISQWCVKDRYLKWTAGIMLTVMIALLIPECIANIGIGKLEPEQTSITMQSESYEVLLYSEQTLFWQFANTAYTTTDNKVAVCVNGIIYSHEPGEAVIKVSLPFKKDVAEYTVKVE